jgi:hypothetical protein
LCVRRSTPKSIPLFRVVYYDSRISRQNGSTVIRSLSALPSSLIPLSAQEWIIEILSLLAETEASGIKLQAIGVNPNTASRGKYL